MEMIFRSNYTCRILTPLLTPSCGLIGKLKLRCLPVPQLGHNRVFRPSLFRPPKHELWEDCLCALGVSSCAWKQSFLDSSLFGIQPQSLLANFPSGLNSPSRLRFGLWNCRNHSHFAARIMLCTWVLTLRPFQPCPTLG